MMRYQDESVLPLLFPGQSQYPLEFPIRFWLANLGQLQGAVGEFLFFLERGPVDFGFSQILA